MRPCLTGYAALRVGRAHRVARPAIGRFLQSAGYAAVLGPWGLGVQFCGGVGPRKQLTLVECSRWIVGPHAGYESMLCAPSKESPKQATRAPE